MTTVEFRKDLFADERDDNLNEIGKPTRRQDILGHVTGRSPYYDDHLFEDLLHLKCARSPHHHARIRRIDISEAERMPGVVKVLLGRDVPVNLNTLLSLLNFGRDDEPVLSEKKVSYIGEPVAAVIARTERQARAAAAAVKVDWEVLPHVLDAEEALAPNAPVVNEAYPNNSFDYYDQYDHQKLRFGDVDAGFAMADEVIEASYEMSPIEQAPIETCGAIAAPETNDRYVCYTGTQGLFFSLGTSAKLLDMPSSRLHFVGGTVGGGFGGKVDSLNEPLAILGCILTGKPVKYAFDRADEMQVGAPRGGERWYVKDGVMRNGRLVARQLTGYFDAGAYTRLTSYAVVKCTGHLPGPYTIPNVRADAFCVFTNRTPATAMRGFGVTGVDFAIETHMDKVAEAVGMDPIEFRILNSYRDGDMKAHRRLAKNCALIECAQVAAEKGNWPIAPEYQAMSSLRDGGGDRALIPNHTATDQDGRIGERRRGQPLPHQQPSGAPSFRPAPPATAAPAERPSYQPASYQPSSYQSTSYQPASSSPDQSTPYAPQPYQPASQAGAGAPQGREADKPREPFQQGVKRPGVSRFSSISGTRRR